MKFTMTEGDTICLPKNSKQILVLAWRLLSKTCATLVDFLKITLNSQDFLSRYRLSEKYFSRNRKLTLPIVVLFLMNWVRSSLQKELDGFFQILHATGIPERKVTAGALCRARRKLSFVAFVELGAKLVSFFYATFPHRRWKGFRLLAVDGSTLRVPSNHETKGFFGVWHPAKGKKTCPLARVSLLYDVLNHLTVHALMSPKNEGERALAAKHLESAGPDDLLLLDRGYTGYAFFAQVLSRKGHFLVRMKQNQTVVKKFLRSGKREQFITLEPSPLARKACDRKGIPAAPLKLRILRFTVKNRCRVILLTSLLDRERFPLSELKELYSKRWEVESAYKWIKCRIEIENFSGKSPLTILQDFHARVLTANLAAVIAHPVQDRLQQEDKEHPPKHARRINFTYALSAMKDNVVSLLTGNTVLEILHALFRLLHKTLSVIRPGRRNPRKKGPKLKLFAMAYKPIA